MDNPHTPDESVTAFEKRKADHIALALDPVHQARGHGLDRIELIHDSLPELNLADVRIQTSALGDVLPTPFLVSAMTLGNAQGQGLNRVLAEACRMKGWAFAVGSQRRQIFDPTAQSECVDIRKRLGPGVLLGNLGLAQAIQIPTSTIQKLADSLEAQAMVLHLNPLQEGLQQEGTPHYRGGLSRIESLVKELTVPIVVKETGCGMSESTLRRLRDVGVRYVDVSGRGGTHWGRIETSRAPENSLLARAGGSFADWGVTTAESLENALRVSRSWEVWASGGIRNGVDAAKCLAMGASLVGMAQPLLQAAQGGLETLIRFMELMEYELRLAMFCSGAGQIESLREVSRWRKK